MRPESSMTFYGDNYVKFDDALDSEEITVRH